MLEAREIEIAFDRFIDWFSYESKRLHPSVLWKCEPDTGGDQREDDHDADLQPPDAGGSTSGVVKIAFHLPVVALVSACVWVAGIGSLPYEI
jgi:hypothetical protein